MTKKLHNLTPGEQARAEKTVYEAWLERQKLYEGPPKPSTRDLVHDNPRVASALTWAVSVIPAMLALIMVTAIFISADTTFTAFSGAASHQALLWSSFIGVLGVIFTEGSLVFSEFARVRSRLQRGLPRQVWSLPQFFRGIGVRLGLKRPLQYDEMPDTNLERFATMVFILVLAANVFVATTPLLQANGTSWTAMTDLDRIYLLFAIFMGVVAPFGLKFVGSQLAELSYELFAQQRAEMEQKLYEEWRRSVTNLWAEEGGKIVMQALHAKYLQKNGLPPDSVSPYLLMAGPAEEGGELQLQAAPLANSREPLPTPSRNESSPSSNGNRETTA
jgi:hypothetical protein